MYNENKVVYMELHIKEFEYQNIIKQQMYKQLIVLTDIPDWYSDTI